MRGRVVRRGAHRGLIARLGRYALVLAVLASAGCARLMQPENPGFALYDPEKSNASGRNSLSFVDTACPPPGTTGYIEGGHEHGHHRKSPHTAGLLVPKYSPGDRLNLYVHQSPEFGGDYIIGPQGTITIPYAGDVKVAGSTTAEVTARIERAMVRGGLFRDQEFRVAVRPVQYSSVNVNITGAVFSPGRATIGQVKETDKSEKFLTRFGDNPTERTVGALLRAAGGIRPDADLSHIKLYRGGRSYTLDWRGAILGYPVDEAILIEGDQLEVPEAGCFQSGLVRPTQITPNSLRIFSSNLTVPATNNNSSAINNSTMGVPYGTRLLQGLVTANCVGGSLASNASRFGVLISRNPKTGHTEVVQRSIEELVRSADRDTINPYLMPEDAIACYDSAVTDFREISQTINALISPIAGIKGLRGQ